MRPISLHHLSMLDAHPFELITAAKAGGFTHCGVRLVSPEPTGTVFDLVHNPRALAEAKQRMEDSGIAMLDAEAIWLRPDTVVADFRAAIEAAAVLGARYFLTVGADEDRSRLLARLGELAALCKDAGIVVALEPIAYSAVTNLHVAADLLAEMAGTFVALLPDSLQFFRSGLQPADLAELPPARVLYAQISDAPLLAPGRVSEMRHEAREDRQVPGEGQLPLIAFVRALPRSAPLAVEVPNVRLRRLSHDDAARVLGVAVSNLLTEADGQANEPG